MSLLSFSDFKVKVEGQNRRTENLPLVIAQPCFKISPRNLVIQQKYFVMKYDVQQNSRWRPNRRVLFLVWKLFTSLGSGLQHGTLLLLMWICLRLHAVTVHHHSTELIWWRDYPPESHHSTDAVCYAILQRKTSSGFSIKAERSSTSSN